MAAAMTWTKGGSPLFDDGDRPSVGAVEPTDAVVVADTGDAEASDNGSANTGYRGPSPDVPSDGAAELAVVTHTGAATASSGGVANSGYIAKLTVIQPHVPRAPAPWPHQVGVLPPTATAFQERPSADALRAIPPGSSVILTGTGGVGKTQLAASLARSAWESSRIDVLVWITAGNRAAVISAYAQAAAEILGISPTDLEHAARAFLSWLEPKRGAQLCRWLIILDGLADPSDMRGLWPPSNPHGTTVVTTQRRDAALAGQGRQFADVGLFTCGEALSYLTEFLAIHDRIEHPDQLAELTTDLGHLPLALSQAAAYVVDAAMSLSDYRSILKERATELRDVLPDPSALPDDQDTTAAAAWSLSIERADLLRPAGLARPMLQLASTLDGSGIPISVLTSKPALTYLADSRAIISGSRPPLTEVSATDALGAVRSLHRLNLVDHNRSDACQTVHTHQLIQRATREALPPEARTKLASAASDSLAASWPDIDRNTRMDQALRANAETLLQVAGDKLFNPYPHVILFRLGRSLGEAGQVDLAISHFRDVAATSERINGHLHPLALAARGNLAAWFGESGAHTEAVTELESIRISQSHLLGANHPHTLTSRFNLGIFRGRSGDYLGAVKELRSLLPDQMLTWGEYHRETLFTRHELARWTGRAGDIAAAIDNLQSLAVDQEHALGPTDPDTLFTEHDLACWKGQAGQPVLAAKSLATLRISLTDVLGADHPRTLTLRGDLARWRAKAGNPAGAVRDLRRLLSDRERILGPSHPSTLTTRNDLASWIGEAGDPAGAVREFSSLIPDLEKVLGPGNIVTLTARDNQITWRARSGEILGTDRESSRLLLDMADFLGSTHPTTLTARHNNADRQGASGDAAGAAVSFRILLIDFERNLGVDHPSTEVCRRGLAYWESRLRGGGR